MVCGEQLGVPSRCFFVEARFSERSVLHEYQRCQVQESSGEAEPGGFSLQTGWFSESIPPSLPPPTPSEGQLSPVSC